MRVWLSFRGRLGQAQLPGWDDRVGIEATGTSPYHDPPPVHALESVKQNGVTPIRREGEQSSDWICSSLLLIDQILWLTFCILRFDLAPAPCIFCLLRCALSLYFLLWSVSSCNFCFGLFLLNWVRDRPLTDSEFNVGESSDVCRCSSKLVSIVASLQKK